MHRRAQHLRSHAMLQMTAVIWGVAFVFQQMAVDAGLPTFLFNALRFALGGAVLLLLVIVMRKRSAQRDTLANPCNPHRDEAQHPRRLRGTIVGGSLMGLALAAGSALQQGGMADPQTGAGKAAFITGLYVVLVPVLGLFVRRRTGPWVWVAVGFALVGLFLLTIQVEHDALSIGRGDLLVFLGSGFWAAHILLIDRLTRRYDALSLSLVQFLVCALCSAGVGLALGERLSLEVAGAGWLAILYCGVVAVGIAFTLQVLGQRHAHPTAAAVILSSEVLFGAIGGAVILGETMSARAYGGCAMMLAGMLIAQLAPRHVPVRATPESA